MNEEYKKRRAEVVQIEKEMLGIVTAKHLTVGEFDLLLSLLTAFRARTVAAAQVSTEGITLGETFP